MRRVDVFAEVVSYEEDTISVRLPSLTASSSDIVKIKFEDSKTFSATKKLQLASKANPGDTVLLSKLSISEDKKVLDGDTLTAGFGKHILVHPSRQIEGFISMKGLYYSNSSDKSDAITEIAHWKTDAMKFGGNNYRTFAEVLERNRSKIQGSHPRATLPYRGYMLRAESNGKLLEYSRPCSSMNDVLNNRDFSPITAQLFLNHSAKFKRSMQEKYGEDTQISISIFNRYRVSQHTKKFNNKPLIDPQKRDHKSLATKTYTRGEGLSKDKFGGHITAKSNGAIVLSNDATDEKGQHVSQWIVNHTSLSGRQFPTALIAPSPYSNKELIPADYLELNGSVDVGTKKEESLEHSNTVSGHLETELPQPQIEDPLKSIDVEKANSLMPAQDVTRSTPRGSFVFYEPGLNINRELVGRFIDKSGAKREFTLVEIESLSNAYEHRQDIKSQLQKAKLEIWELRDRISQYQEHAQRQKDIGIEPSPT